MELLIDDDVKEIAQLMQERLPASRLVSVANGLKAIAPLLWGQYPAEGLQVLRLVSPPSTSD